MNTLVPKGVINLFVLTLKFNRKTAVFVVIMVALVLVGIILLASAHSKAEQLSQQTENSSTIINVKNETDRTRYLAQFGWEVQSPALSHDTVVIPRTFSDVFEEYNNLQKQQGFDLSDYSGLEVEMYTYKITNYKTDEEVVAQLYVRNNTVVGGDVHSTALDGFMVGIKNT